MVDVKLKDLLGIERTYSGVKTLEIPTASGGTTTFFYPEGNAVITDTQEIDVREYATAQVVDANLVPENIAEDVTVLGITGVFKGGGNLQDKKEIYPDDVSPYYSEPMVIKADEGYDGIKEVNIYFPTILDSGFNILLGSNVLGINGYAEYKVLGYAITDAADDAVQRRSSQILYINNRYDLSTFLRQFDSEEYLLAFIIVGGSMVEEGMIYRLSATNTSLTLQDNNDGQILATLYTVNNGWRYSQFDFAQLLPGATELVMVIDHDYGFEDIIDYCFAKKDIAFGDWIKRPTETLHITKNGTYDVTGYAQVIVDVAGGGGDADPTVDGKTLVFDDATSVDGKTFVLDIDATIEGKTLVFGGTQPVPAGPTVDGKLLAFDDETAVDGKTLALDAEASISGKTLSFGEVEEDVSVDGKDLVTSGSVNGKTAILDGHIEGKTLIL